MHRKVQFMNKVQFIAQTNSRPIWQFIKISRVRISYAGYLGIVRFRQEASFFGA